jgi:PadR family transcriptional regulator AphA
VAERDDLSAGEWAVLALVAEGPCHGWAAVRALAPEGDIGRVWSLPRPLVYRALDLLAGRGLIEEHRVEGSAQGPRRTVMRVTKAGKARIRAWLGEPVEHVRDVRWLLLMKLLFCERAGVDPLPLLEAQSATLEPIVAGLTRRVRSARADEQMLASFRLESARAARRFVDGQLKLAAARQESTSGARST